MPAEATREVVPTRGNTPGGQRSPGHRVANESGPWEDMTGTAWSNLSPGGRSWWRTSRPEGKPMGRCTTHLPSPTTWVASWSSRRGGRQTTGARGGVCGSALKLPPRWAGLFSDKWRAEPRPEPGLGKSDRPGSQGGFENRDQSRLWCAGARAQFRARQPHARFDGRGLETERYSVTAPAPDSTILAKRRRGDSGLAVYVFNMIQLFNVWRYGRSQCGSGEVRLSGRAG